MSKRYSVVEENGEVPTVIDSFDDLKSAESCAITESMTGVAHQYCVYDNKEPLYKDVGDKKLVSCFKHGKLLTRLT